MLTSYAVLELGSGTGLVGMAAAAVWGLNVTLTDLEDVEDNLRFNIQKNYDKVVEVRGGHVSAEVLDWKHPDEALASCPTKEFEVLFEPIYYCYLLTSIAGHCCRLFLR
jgi:predicted nicotinamide N-methyase